MRINQILMYAVAWIILACIYVGRYDEMICKIAILGFVISIIKSFLYYIVYDKLMEVYNQADDNPEEKSENKEDKED